MLKTLSTLLFALYIISVLCSCGIKKDNKLSANNKKYLSELGLLEANEQIILFDSQGGGLHPIKHSGNFFTDKRIAAYWIDERHKSESHIEYAFYQDIDTIWRYPKYRSLTLASYLEVHRKDGTKFKVYVNGDSAATWKFFNRALHEWCENTNKK